MRAVVILVLCFVAVAMAGTCSHPNRPRDTSYEVPATNTYCPQYSKDTCCVPQFLNIREASIDDGCIVLPDQCAFLKGLVECAYECKPDFSDFVDTTNNLQIRLCAVFYESLTRACGDALSCPNPNRNTTFDCRTPDGKKLCGRNFNTPDDFWNPNNRFHFRVGPYTFVKATDNTNCFSGASLIAPAMGLLVAVVALLF